MSRRAEKQSRNTGRVVEGRRDRRIADTAVGGLRFATAPRQPIRTNSPRSSPENTSRRAPVTCRTLASAPDLG